MIYVKINKDNIPHNYNFANALYGFREMGAEIVSYYEIKDILANLKKEDIVLDYISQVQAVFDKFGRIYDMPNYPDVLKKYLKRKVWKDTINSISCNENKWSKGYFVKPIKDKAFTGKIISSIKDLVGCGSCYEDYEVLVSEPLDIRAEWRGFVYYDKLIDLRPYGAVFNNDYIYHNYDINIVKNIMNDFCTWKDRPNACSIDIAVVNKDDKEETVLVECNDCYALGCYGLNSIMYAKMISARWSQIMGIKDEYKF